MSRKFPIFPSLVVVAAFVAVPFVSIQPFELSSATAITLPHPPLGDLSSFRDIAVDTLHIVKSGRLAEAKIRVKDLETVWDHAAASMKPMDPEVWRAIDAAIDNAIAALREPSPDAMTCITSLRDLIRTIDAYDR